MIQPKNVATERTQRDLIEQARAPHSISDRHVEDGRWWNHSRLGDRSDSALLAVFFAAVVFANAAGDG
jgi:hypothetical protein